MTKHVWYVTSLAMYAQVLLKYIDNGVWDGATVCASILAYIAAVLSKK